MRKHIAWICALMVAGGALAQEGPRSPAETIKAFKLPDGYSMTLFAGEPDLHQPIGFCFDDRGRLWVAENNTYPAFNAIGNDRIVIYEDVDGDGRFDKKTVFYDKLNYLTGLEVGFGGVYVVSAPNLLFIPDRDHDDKPDGPPEVLLEGFGHQGVHNLVNGCTWGPDGWLYGGHGGTSSGMIGKPGTPNSEKVFFDGGVWRYHPTRKIFEPIMEGTTNPWGMDFDDYGQCFISNSVTPHLYHVIMGGHVERRRESPNSRYAYEVLPPAADHKHWQGTTWIEARSGKADQLVVGGGHAHCGLMIYLGDNWPDARRGSIYINNIHGDRMNNDLPIRKGSGYTASHSADFLTCADPWYMGLHVKYGPDGGVFLSDWYDTGECHTKRPHVENGRIYKITYGTPTRMTDDVSRLTSAELVKLQLHKNDWWVRRARRVLQERGADSVVWSSLLGILKDNADVTRRLRALWALHVTGGAGEELLLGLLKDPNEYVRGWAVQLLAEGRNPSPMAMSEYERLAKEDASPWVRLQIVSALTRLPVGRRWAVLANLVARGEDAADQNLPLMEWYALEPMVVTDPRRALALAMAGKMPKLREFAARRIVELSRTTKDTKSAKN